MTMRGYLITRCVNPYGGSGNQALFGLDDLFANSKARQIGDRVEVELIHDAFAVSFDGFDGNVEAGGDILGGVSFGDELKDLSFTRGLQFRRTAGGRGEIDIVADEHTGNSAAEIYLAAHDGANSRNQFFEGRIFQQVPPGAGLDRFRDIVSIGVHGEDDDASRGLEFLQLAHGLQSVQTRHGDVEEEDIGSELVGHVDCLVAVHSFSDNADVGTLLEHGTESGAKQEVVISQYQSDSRHQVFAASGASRVMVVP